MGPSGSPQSRDALSLRGVPMVGALAAGEGWALSGGVLVPTALPTVDIQAELDSIADTRGYMLRRGASDWEGLPLGSTGHVLTFDGTDPAWAANAATRPDPSVILQSVSIWGGADLTFANTSVATMDMVATNNSTGKLQAYDYSLDLTWTANTSGHYARFTLELSADGGVSFAEAARVTQFGAAGVSNFCSLRGIRTVGAGSSFVARFGYLSENADGCTISYLDSYQRLLRHN